jgi:S-adenosylmethionine/arginine decarboxylase-like enzyme
MCLDDPTYPIDESIGLSHPGRARTGRSETAYVAWGLSASIDLHDCVPEWLSAHSRIVDFFAELVPAIGMVAHGPLVILRFGVGDLEGWSAMQFIETSSITLHSDEYGLRCFVDIFSCKSFDPTLASTVAVAHFGGRPTVRAIER